MLSVLTGQYDHLPNPGDTFWYATVKDGQVVPQSKQWSDDFGWDTTRKQSYFNPGTALVTDYAVGWGNCFINQDKCQAAINRDWFAKGL